MNDFPKKTEGSLPVETGSDNEFDQENFWNFKRELRGTWKKIAKNTAKPDRPTIANLKRAINRKDEPVGSGESIDGLREVIVSPEQIQETEQAGVLIVINAAKRATPYEVNEIILLTITVGNSAKYKILAIDEPGPNDPICLKVERLPEEITEANQVEEQKPEAGTEEKLS